MPDIATALKAMPPMMWVALGLVIALKVFLLWWNSPKRKGARGERLVAKRLRDGLPDEYRILNDVYLPMPDGTTTQIDHIVVSRYGIFVVETKAYSGWIFGGEKDREWTQTFRCKKSRFQNPIRQNYRHICAIADSLGIDRSYCISVVVFTGGGTFKTAMPPGVVCSRRAAEYVLSHKAPRIQAAQLDELVSAIAGWQDSLSQEQIENHVANLEK